MKWLALVVSICVALQNVMTDEQYDIIILGAGMSALGAIKKLKDRGITNFVVLEANDYIGGRVKNFNMGDASLPLGAGWVHLWDSYAEDGTKYPDHIMKQLMEKYGMTSVADVSEITTYDVWNRKTGTKFTTSEIQETLQKFQSARLNGSLLFEFVRNGGDMNLASLLRWGGWYVRNGLDLLLEYYSIDFFSATSPVGIGVAPYLQRHTGTDEIITDPRGYIYPALTEIGNEKNRIKLKTVVTKVKKNDRHDYTIYTKDGKEWKAKQVLVTFSTGVLNADIVKFEPKLPNWKRESLAMVPMAYLCKVFTKFPKKFWSDKRYFFTSAEDRQGYFLWQNPSAYGLTNVLIAFVVGDACKNLGKYNDEEIIDQIYNVMKDIYKDEAVKPESITRNTFNHDERFMGSYSYQTPGVKENDFRALEHPVDEGLWFAGEYLGRYASSYAHSAYKSGLDIAEKMIKCQDGDCPKGDPVKEPQCPPSYTGGTGDYSNSIIHHISVIQILFVTFVAIIFVRRI